MEDTQLSFDTLQMLTCSPFLPVESKSKPTTTTDDDDEPEGASELQHDQPCIVKHLVCTKPSESWSVAGCSLTLVFFVFKLFAHLNVKTSHNH